MHLCRECEVLLWLRHDCCPACAARAPQARARTARRRGAAVDSLAAAVAVTTAFALPAADRALRWLLLAA